MSALAGRELVEGQVAVHAHVLRQPEHALGDDVAQDFVGARGDAPAGRGEQRFLEGGAERRNGNTSDERIMVLDVEGQGAPVAAAAGGAGVWAPANR